MLQTIAAGGLSRSTRPCCNRSLRRPITCPSSPPAEPSSSAAWCGPDRLHLQSRKAVAVAHNLAHVHPLGDPNDVAGYKVLLNCWAGFCGHMVVANLGLIWHGHAENDPPALLPASRGGDRMCRTPPSAETLAAQLAFRTPRTAFAGPDAPEWPMLVTARRGSWSGPVTKRFSDVLAHAIKNALRIAPQKG